MTTVFRVLKLKNTVPYSVVTKKVTENERKIVVTTLWTSTPFSIKCTMIGTKFLAKPWKARPKLPNDNTKEISGSSSDNTRCPSISTIFPALFVTRRPGRKSFQNHESQIILTTSNTKVRLEVSLPFLLLHDLVSGRSFGRVPL